VAGLTLSPASLIKTRVDLVLYARGGETVVRNGRARLRPWKAKAPDHYPRETPIAAVTVFPRLWAGLLVILDRASPIAVASARPRSS